MAMIGTFFSLSVHVNIALVILIQDGKVSSKVIHELSESSFFVVSSSAAQCSAYR